MGRLLLPDGCTELTQGGSLRHKDHFMGQSFSTKVALVRRMKEGPGTLNLNRHS